MVASDQKRRVPSVLRRTIRFAGLSVPTGTILAASAIALAAFFMWFEQRSWLRSLPALTGDAVGYYERAQAPTPFYAAHIREPLFPAFLRLGFFLTNSQDQVVARRVSGWANIGLVVAIGLLGLKVAGTWGGIIAPWLYAGTPLTSYYGVSGLRESSTGLLVILFVLVLLCDRSWPARLGAAVCAAVIPLLRLEGLFIIPLLTGAWALIRWHKHFVAEALALTAIAWLVAAPFLVNCQRAFGSPFYNLNVHATYWRNHEFAGQPGHLTREEVLTDGYAGPRTTSFAYIFGLHSVPEVMGRYVTGYWVALTKYVPFILSGRWLFWAWTLGMAWALADWRNKGFVVAAGLIAQLPFAFIIPLDMVMADRLHPGVEFRFSLPIATFVPVWAGLGIAATIAWAQKKWWA